jgi:ATP-dependent Clp protease protease subunit
MGAGFSIKAKANQEADVYIYEDVGAGWFGGVTAKQFADDLKAIGSVSTINLRINSAGGDVFDGLAIYRLLVDHKAKVITYIDGLAASIASVIACAGDEINVSEAGFVMIHDAWGVSMGNAADMRRMADLLDTTSGSIADVYVARTKNSAKSVRDWMAGETWFTGKEAAAPPASATSATSPTRSACARRRSHAPGRRDGRAPAQRRAPRPTARKAPAPTAASPSRRTSAPRS